MSTKLSLNVAS